MALPSRRLAPERDGQAPASIDKAAKLALLSRADDAARSAGAAITQVQAAYGDGRRRVLIASTDGRHAEDDQIRTRFSVSCVATGDTGMQTGYESFARTEGFEVFERFDVEGLARVAAERAIRKLDARPAPSGELQSCSPAAAAACSSTRPAGTGSRPTTS